MTKKPSEKNKTWEKDRRERLNKAFDELAKLLPQYDSTVVWSKNDIIQKSIVYITDLQQRHEKVLENQDPKALNDYKELLDTIKFFRLRNNQLAALLKKANITIPTAKFPKLVSNLRDDDNDLEFKPRPVGRPKKYSNLVMCNGNCNKRPSKENKENDDANKSSKDETDRPIVVESIVSSATIVTTTSPATTTVPATPAVVTTTNATITAGVLLPLIPCQPLPQTNNSHLAPLPNPTPIPKCNILSIQTLPHLTGLARKLAKTRAGKVKILPNPVVKLHVRRTDNKVPIPALKRTFVAVKRKRRCRKRKIGTKQLPVNCKRRKSETAARDSVINNEAEKVDPKHKHRIDPPRIHKDERNNETDVVDNDKIDDHISLPENDLPDEYFSSIHMADVNSGSTSVSPTAAFLLSFPVVSANTAGKNVCEAEESPEGELNERSDNNNLSEGLENLNNFFSTKEYYRFCSQNASLADKGIDVKPSVPDGLIPAREAVGENILATSSRNLLTPLITSLKTNSTSVDAPKSASGVFSTKALPSTPQNYAKENIVSTASSIVSTADVLSSSSISKSSVYSSNFFVSNIFTTTVPTIVTSKSSVALGTTLDNRKNISDPVKPAPNFEKPPIMNSLSNVLPSSSTCGFPSRFSASMSQPTKLNQIPNPIPAPLPHPTNFPNPSDSYPTFGKFASGRTSESQYFDANIQPSVGKSIGTTGVFDIPSTDMSGSSHNLSKIQPSSSSTTNSGLSVSKERLPVTLANSIAHTTQLNASNYALSKSDKKGLLLEATGKANQMEMTNYISSSSSNQVKSSAQYPEKHRPVVTTATISSKSVPTISNSSKPPYPLASNFVAHSHMESYSNLNNTLKSHIPTIAQTVPLNSSSKVHPMQHIATSVADKPISTYPVTYPTTTSYYYPEIVPPISTPFTFSLASTTATTIASTQSQPYLSLPNVIQSNEWTAPSTAIDYQTPFTFSLTSCTSTSTRSSQAVSSYPYYKAAGGNVSNLKSSTNNLPSTKLFNAVPDMPPTSLLCPPGSLELCSKTLSTIPATSTTATNFTFSLAKPKTTNTTVSAQFMKTMPSTSVTDSKYPPYYNAYNFNNYSNSYSKEATNFTFALTKPTNSMSSTSSQSTDVKTSQRFTSSFSIDATLGVSTANSYHTQQRVPKHSQTTVQGANVHQKTANVNNPSNLQQTASATKNPSNYYESSHEKQSKVAQKSHVNWMTSQSSELTSCRQQPSYYPSYVAPTVDYTNKSNYFAPSNIDDNFPPWSPSKILDTGHLFQSVPMQQPYYNEFNSFVPNNSENFKTYPDAQKSCSKPCDVNGKTEKECNKPIPSGSSSQTSFFSVSQLVDQNFSKPCETYSKRNTPQKAKDARKSAGSSLASSLVQSAYQNQKNSTSNYSAEALISKKEKHRNNPLPSTVQHYHNPDYYSAQGDFHNSYVAQEPENPGYNANYFFNYLPPNQNYMQDSDYPGCSQQDRIRSKGQSSNSDCKTVEKKHQPVVSAALTNMLPYESGNFAPPLASSVSGVESYDPIHYSNNIQHTSWNVSRNTAANFPGGQAVIPFGEEGNLTTCLNEVATGNSGNNLTNFNLSSICPEISGKVDHSNNW